jgi:ankyrin repeat protein
MLLQIDTRKLLNFLSKQGYLEVVKVLIEAGADVHAWDDAALHDASKNRHLEVVKFLIEVGAKLPD